MRLNLRRWVPRIATAGLLGLFPIFILYHYLLAQGWIPPVFGGLFGMEAAALALLATLLLPWIITRQLGGAAGQGALLGLTIGYIALWTVVNSAFIGFGSYLVDAFRQSASTLVIWLALVFVGAFYSLDGRASRSTLVVLGLLIAVAMVHAMVRFRSPLGPWITFAANDEDSPFSTYQAIGRSLLVTAILIAALARRRRSQIAILGIGVISLLLIGSRSDFFALALLTGWLTLHSIYRRRSSPIGFVGILVCIGVAAVFWPIFLKSRNAEILDLSTSSSWQARMELEAWAMRVIRDHPIFGDFGYYLREGGAGSYAHNVLSAWTNFGFLGFALYLGSIAYCAVLSFRRWLRTDSFDPVWFVAFNVNMAALVQAVAASPVFAALPALGWGLVLNGLRREHAAGEATDPPAQQPTVAGLAPIGPPLPEHG